MLQIQILKGEGNIKISLVSTIVTEARETCLKLSRVTDYVVSLVDYRGEGNYESLFNWHKGQEILKDRS